MPIKKRKTNEGPPSEVDHSLQRSPEEGETSAAAAAAASSSGSGSRPSSTIIGISRSIAACQRCRQKKTKCDQKFPSCAKCEKAGVPCVGLDPATGRQVPRSYVIYLEDKVNKLENLLKQSGIDPTAGPLSNHSSPASLARTPNSTTSTGNKSVKMEKDDGSIQSSMDLAVPPTNTNGLSFYIGDSSGISFAKLLFTAVNFNPGSINENNSITTRGPSTQQEQTKSSLNGLPTKSTAEFFLKTFFEQSNTQLPILHREYFIDNYFKPIYGNISPNLTLASNYTQMNLDRSPIKETSTWFYIQNGTDSGTAPAEFHKPLFFLNMLFAIASSVNLLQYNAEISNSYKLEAMKYIDSIYSSPDRLECLQGLLSLTLYSTMRPSTPGVWYVLGTTLRLCVDLGLHTEKLNNQFTPFVKDLRRRLFWCSYSLDRQICVYLGRPFGIPEESISTKFPVELDDCLINTSEEQDFNNNANSLPSYKIISINFFRIRRIQAEILQVLYFTTSTLPRFYNNLNDWKTNIDNRLENWFKTIPLKTSRKSNCDFNFEFFKLNYYHTKLLLFGITPKNNKLDDRSIKIIFEASKGMILSYDEFFKSKTINYTWAAVHNLFMAGTSFFYSIFHTNDKFLIDIMEFNKIVGIVVKVLNSLTDSCDAASPCVEIFETLALVMTKLRFGGPVNNNVMQQNSSSSNDLTTSVDQGAKFDDLDRFFDQLNKISDPNNTDPGVFKDFQYSSIFEDTTPEDYYDNNNYQSLSTPPTTTFVETQTQTDHEQQRIFDMISRVSSDTIWEQFFGNSGF